MTILPQEQHSHTGESPAATTGYNIHLMCFTRADVQAKHIKWIQKGYLRLRRTL